MIYVEPRAGLSNRMRVIASAYNLSKKYNTKMIVLWRVSKGLNASFYSLFKPIKNLEVKESKHKLSILFALCAIKANRYYKNISMNTDIGRLEKNLEQGKDVYICTVHQFSDVGHYDIFHPIESIERKAQYLIDKITDDTIGVHIRRTDNTKAIERSPVELFTKRMDEKMKNCLHVSFYLATDSGEINKYLKNRYKERILSAANIKLERSSQEGMEGALIDLICLSKCKVILGSYYSSFSEIAAEWGNRELYILDKKCEVMLYEKGL